MEILKLIDELESQVTKSANIPILGRCMIEKSDALAIIREMRSKLPEDLKKARRVIEESQKHIADAQKEGKAIIRDAESKVQLLVDSHEIAKKAEEQARELIDNAQKKARDIRLGSREYVDGMLSDLEAYYKDNLSQIQTNRKSLK